MQLSRLAIASKGKIEFIYINGRIKPTEEDCKSPAIMAMQHMFPGKELLSYASYVKTPPLPEGELLDYKGLDATLEYLQFELQERAPIDGVLGFSQGGNMASLLAAQAVKGQGMPLAFVVHMSSTEPGWAHQYPDFYREPLPIPSFHLWGKADPNVGTLFPEHLPEYYAWPEIANHTGDHRPLPASRDEADTLSARVLDFMLRAAAA